MAGRGVAQSSTREFEARRAFSLPVWAPVGAPDGEPVVYQAKAEADYAANGTIRAPWLGIRRGID
jgi:hypothetical protein